MYRLLKNRRVFGFYRIIAVIIDVRLLTPGNLFLESV